MLITIFLKHISPIQGIQGALKKKGPQEKKSSFDVQSEFFLSTTILIVSNYCVIIMRNRGRHKE